jgi:hypothetical protein
LTHPGSSPNPSSTDEATFKESFGVADWAVMFIMARSGAMYARMRMKSGDMDMQINLPVETAYNVPFPASNHEQWKMDIKERVTQQGISFPKSEQVAEKSPAAGYRYQAIQPKKKPKAQPATAPVNKQPLKFPNQQKQTKPLKQVQKTPVQRTCELLTKLSIGKTLQSVKFFGGRFLYRDLANPELAKLLNELNVTSMNRVSDVGDMLFAIKVPQKDDTGKIAWTDIHEAPSSEIISALRDMGLLTYQEPVSRKIGSLSTASNIDGLIEYAIKFFASRDGNRKFDEHIVDAKGRTFKARFVAEYENKNVYLTPDENDLIEDIANGYFASIEEVKRGLMTLLRGEYNGPAVMPDNTFTPADIPGHVISEEGDIIITGPDDLDELWYTALISAGVNKDVAARLSKASSMTAVINELSSDQQEKFLNALENTETLNGK